MLSVEDDVGIRTIMDELMAASKDPVPGMRRVKLLFCYLKYVTCKLTMILVRTPYFLPGGFA